MLLPYYTQTILFYFGLSSFNANNDFTTLQSLENDYLKKEVCVAQCLERRTTQMQLKVAATEIINKTSLGICMDNCVTTNNATQQEAIQQIYENYSFNLICRDDGSLNFLVDLQTINKRAPSTLGSTTVKRDANGSEVHGTLFAIKIHLANDSKKFLTYLSDDNFFTINELMANTTYNISVTAVHANNKYSVIAQQQQFSTLPRSYTPNNVTEIKIGDFIEDKRNKKYLTATMTWKPAADMTCHYDIICFSPDSEDYDLQPLEIRNPRELYKYQLENLTFSSVYQVGIRARNTKGIRESQLLWKTFEAPTCVEFHNYNFNICAPEAPQNLHIEQLHIHHNIYSLNISWLLPTYLPDNYTLRIEDLSEEGQTEVYNLTKEVHNFFIPQIPFNGVFYHVTLTAYTRGGHAATYLTELIKTIVHVPEKNPFVKLIAVILAPIFCVAILALTIFIIYYRRAKLKRYQERCKYFEELEKKAPIDSKENYNFTTNIKPKSDELQYKAGSEEITLFNDDMEIDGNNLTLYEVLGEGAFGLVKRGIYKDIKLGTSQEVAVKMLKDHPSADDVRAFCREIEVMKSVEKHPNIVGIIGHCTSLSNEIMLLTEYCCFGNLLNFLRNEWRFLHELQQKKQALTKKGIVDIELPEIRTQEIAEPINNQNLQLSLTSHHASDDDCQNLNKCKISNDAKIPECNKSDIVATDNLKHKDVDDNDVIERFKDKYNDFKAVTHPLYDFNSSNNINNNNDESYEISLQYVEVLNKSTTIVSQDQLTETIQSPTISVVSPARENKSYGYQGCCTNACKSNVDVVIRPIDSTLSSKETEELDRLLRQDQKKQPCSTTVEIKDCDCKMLQQCHQSSRNTNIKCNSAVENKSYFKMFNTAKYQSSKQIPTIFSSTELKTKSKKLLPQTTVHTKDECANESLLSRIPLSAGDLLDIARQVAVGMEFLSMNKVVHRDLAARNVLVSPDRTVKIADFGLSRDVYQENMYKKMGNGKLPIKWLALESMTHQMYTTQSDVWSYGILLYEIVTLGATPYPSIPTNRLLHLLKSGYRMEKPKNCGQEFYNLMYSCWNSVPSERPTFNEIIQKIDDMLNRLNLTSDVYALTTTATTMPMDDRIMHLNEDNGLVKHESPIEQISSDESYLKPL